MKKFNLATNFLFILGFGFMGLATYLFIDIAYSSQYMHDKEQMIQPLILLLMGVVLAVAGSIQRKH